MNTEIELIPSFGGDMFKPLYYAYFFTLQACNLEGWLYMKIHIMLDSIHDCYFLEGKNIVTVIYFTLKHCYFLLSKEP